MKRSIKEIIESNPETEEAKELRESIKSTIAKWKELYEKLPNVVRVSDYSCKLPADYIFKIDVHATLESFVNSCRLIDIISIFVDDDANIFLDKHSLKNLSERSTDILDEWAEKYYPDEIYTGEHGFSRLHETLQILCNMYRQSIPEPVNSNAL